MKTKILLPYVATNVALAFIAALLLVVTDDALLWAGVLIANASGPLYLMLVVGSGRVARTSAKLPGMQLSNVAGFLMVLYAVLGKGELSMAAIGGLFASVLGVIFVQWYVHIYSIYDRTKSSSIIVGQLLPDLSLEQLDGKSIESTSFKGSKTLLVFFRANWCPLCMAQLKEVVDRSDTLSDLGVVVRFISNQSPDKSRALGERLDLPQHFEILHDRGLRAAKALKIEDINGTPLGMADYPRDTVMATVIALDEDARVIFGDETDNYRVRPHPDTFIDVFRGRADQ